MKETNITDESEKDKITSHVKGHSKKARKRQLVKHVSIVVILAAAITAVFTGYYIHQEQIGAGKKAEVEKEEGHQKKKKKNQEYSKKKKIFF